MLSRGPRNAHSGQCADNPTYITQFTPGTRSVARRVRSGVCVLVRARVRVRARARARVRVGVAVGRVRPGRSSRAAGAACTWWSPAHAGVSKVVSSWPTYYSPRVHGGRLRTSTLSVHEAGAAGGRLLAQGLGQGDARGDVGRFKEMQARCGGACSRSDSGRGVAGLASAAQIWWNAPG